MARQINRRRPQGSGKITSGRNFLFNRSTDAYLDKADRTELAKFRERCVARVVRDNPNYFAAAGVLFVVLLFEHKREALETLGRTLPLPEDMEPRSNGHVIRRLNRDRLLKRAGTGESKFDSSNHGLRNIWRLRDEAEAFTWLQKRAGWLVRELRIPNPTESATTSN